NGNGHGPVEATLVVEPDRADRRAEREERRRTGQRRLVPMVVAIVLLITVALAAAALAQVRSPKPINIPGFIGLSTDQAQAKAKTTGVDVTVGQSRNAPDPAGIVIDQNPHTDTFSSNHHVTLVVSAGPARVAVPNIEKTQWSAASKALDAAGLLY